MNQGLSTTMLLAIPLLLVSGAPEKPSSETGRWRSAFSTVSAPAEVRGALSWLLRDVVLVDDAAAAEAVVAQRSDLTAVTRIGEVFSAWLVAGGSAEGPSLFEVRAQLSLAEEEAEALGRELDVIHSGAKDVSERLAAARATGSAPNCSSQVRTISAPGPSAS